jgi:hypothetical protein
MQAGKHSGSSSHTRTRPTEHRQRSKITQTEKLGLRHAICGVGNLLEILTINNCNDSSMSAAAKLPAEVTLTLGQTGLNLVVDVEIDLE